MKRFSALTALLLEARASSQRKSKFHAENPQEQRIFIGIYAAEVQAAWRLA